MLQFNVTFKVKRSGFNAAANVATFLQKISWVKGDLHAVPRNLSSSRCSFDAKFVQLCYELAGCVPSDLRLLKADPVVSNE